MCIHAHSNRNSAPRPSEVAPMARLSPLQRRRAERGVVHIEYLVVFLLLLAISAACLVALGPHVVDWFAFLTAWLALPVP